MKTAVLLFASLFAMFTFTGCGPSAAEKRAQQVAQAKDDALKLRQQLAQAKSGEEADKLRQELLKGLGDAGLTVDSIHFTEAELNDYVKTANAAATAAAAKQAKAAPQPKGRRAALAKKRRR